MLQACFLALVFTFIFSGCTSNLKRQCQETNWFLHGQNLALQGRRVTGDSWVMSCQKEDVSEAQALDQGFKSGRDKYCTADNVFQNGRSGDSVNFNFCEEQSWSLLKHKHKQGLDAYCSPENSFQAGSSGKVYTKMCSQEQEKKFFPGYYQGRKTYLNTKIEKNNLRLKEISSFISNYERDRGAITNHLAALPPPKYEKRTTCSKDEKGHETCTQSTEMVDGYSSERTQLHSQLHDIHNTISNYRSEENQILVDNRNYSAELETLPDFKVSLKSN